MRHQKLDHNKGTAWSKSGQLINTRVDKQSSLKIDFLKKSVN